MVKIVIEVDKSFAKDLDDAAVNFKDEVAIISSDKFEGNSEIIQALVVLGGVTIPVIGKIIIEAIRAKKHVVVKKRGLTISGISQKNVLRILKDLSRED